MFKNFIPSLLQLALATAMIAEASPLRQGLPQPLIKPRRANETIPKNYGVVVFRAMLMQDMIGVIDPLQVLALEHPMNLYILSETMDPVTTEPAHSAMNKFNSSFWPTINPTHTFANAPDDIEVLIVPGGPGVRAPDVTPITDFIRDTYPKLKYLLTVCTGAGLAAKAGVLDGRKATTNKQSWSTITSYGPKTEWVSPARWVVDGNIWSASGVTSGMDLAFAWIEHIFGQQAVDMVSGREEYIPNPQTYDPFAAKFNITPTGSI